MSLSRLSLGCLAAASLSFACTGNDEPDPAPSFDDEVRGQIKTALRVVAKCGKRGGGALDAACVAAAKNEASVVDGVADQVSHDAICRTLKSVGGDANAYYVQGASVSKEEDGDQHVDVARVWDLRRGQFTSFVTSGIGASGADDAFVGFATSQGERDVAAAWTGRTFTTGGDFDSSLRTDKTSSAHVVDDKNELRLQVGYGPSGQSLSAFALGGKPMHVLDGIETESGSFTTIHAGDGLDAGTALAVHLLQLSGGQPGSFSAALAAIVNDTSKRIDAKGQCGADEVLAQSVPSKGISPRGVQLIVGQSVLLNFDFDPFSAQEPDPSPDPAQDHLQTEIVMAAFIPCQSLGWSDWTTGCFTGDNRGYDYGSAMSQSRLAGKAVLAGEGAPSSAAYVGETHMLNCGDTSGSNTCTTINDGAQVQKTKRAPLSSISIQPVGLSPDQDKVRIVFSGKNPLVALAPAIDGTVDIFVSYEVQDGRRVRVTGYSTEGTHDGFPAWELYINGLRVHEYDPIAKGCTPLSLAGGCQQKVKGSFGP